MLKVEKIKFDIESLTKKEYIRLMMWLFERDWEKWEQEIYEDSHSGKLDFLIREASGEKKGSLREL